MNQPKFRLVELLAEKSLQEGRLITDLKDLTDGTGIDRRRLYSFRDNTAKSIKPEEIKALCDYFGCTVDDLIDYTPPLEEGQEKLSGLVPEFSLA